MISLVYSKNIYQAKITELEGYYNQLDQHLARMESLKEQMYNFWDDSNAQTTGQVLAIQIRSVRNAMDRTSDMINFYKTAVDKLDAAGGLAMDILETAMGVLGGGAE